MIRRASIFFPVFLSSPVAAQECPAVLVLKVKGLPGSDVRAAQQYATCMSSPWLPMSAELEQKSTGCLKPIPHDSGSNLQMAVSWTDHIATQFPGCETRLEIKRK
jgi:hypothetical protein